jgi:hypothetical protein
MSITFGGTTTLSAVRSTKDLNQTPVTVTLNGVVVGTGTIDGNGRVKITLPGIPAGSTVVVTAGSVSVTVVLAMTAAATAVSVTVNSDGTVTVKAAADPNNTGVVTPDEDEQQDETEDKHGNVIEVDNQKMAALPANLPFTLTNVCGTITVTPASAAVAFLQF